MNLEDTRMFARFIQMKIAEFYKVPQESVGVALAFTMTSVPGEMMATHNLSREGARLACNGLTRACDETSVREF